MLKGGFMKKIRDIFEPYMVRPLIYMTFTRFVLSLFILLLIDFFLSPKAGRPIKGTVFLLGSAVFAVLALIARLRLDGLRLPKLLMMRVNPRKKTSRMYGDMIDYIDERPEIAFEDLDDREKDICILAADLFCFIVFLAAGLLIRP